MAFQLAAAYVQFSQRGLSGVSGAIGNIFHALTSLISPANLAAAALSALGATIGVGGMLKLAADTELAAISLETLMGSSEAGLKRLKEIERFAAETPFEFPELIVAHRQMLAMGFAADETMHVLRTLGDTTAAFGGGPELLERITRALGQMQAKSIVSAEEMRQLAEAGVPAWKMLADVIGTDIPTAMKLAEQRMISADVAVPGLLNALTDKYGGAMKKMSQTSGGLFSTLRDNLRFLLRDIGQIMIDTFDLKAVIRNMTEFVAAFRDKYGPSIIRAFQAIKKTLIAFFGPIWDAMKAGWSEFANMVSANAGDIAALWKEWIHWVQQMGRMMASVGRLLWTIFVKLAEAVMAFMNPVTTHLAFSNFSDMVTYFADAVRNSQKLRDILNGIVLAARILGFVIAAVYRYLQGVAFVLGIAYEVTRRIINPTIILHDIWKLIAATIDKALRRALLLAGVTGAIALAVLNARENASDQRAKEAEEDAPYRFKSRGAFSLPGKAKTGEFLSLPQLAEHMQRQASQGNDLARQIKAAETAASGIDKLNRTEGSDGLRVRVVNASEVSTKNEPRGM